MPNFYTDTIVGNFRLEFIAHNRNIKNEYGEMMVCVYDKNTQELLQTIESESFYFNDKKGISNSFSFTDYNFDRYNNISFFSLVNGAYGTHRSEYFAYNPKTNQFEYDDFFNDEIVS